MRFKRPGVRYADTPVPETPYQRAGQVWDERLGASRAQARNWRMMAFGSLALSVMMAGGLVWQSGRSTITPYVVEVDHQGDVRAVGAATAAYQPADAQIANHLSRFITDVRSLPLDPIVVRQDWLEAYDYSTDRGAAVLNDYARINDPFGKVGKQSIAVDIVSVVRASPASFQVRWIERTYDNGALTATDHWTAILSIVVQPPHDEAQLRKNPLGIYVNGLNWSRELGSGG
jgi:type IV secretory pathway TrbF-like protein